MTHPKVIILFSKMARRRRRKPNTKLRCKWSEEDLQETAKRTKFHEIGIDEVSGVYKIPSHTV